jgi:hypothetical protein
MTDDATAHAKETQKKGAEQKEKIVAEAYGHQGKPTPTQEENDLAALGVPLETHEDDGSGPSPEVALTVTRQSESEKPSGGNYQTRNLEPSRERSTTSAAAKEQPKETTHHTKQS